MFVGLLYMHGNASTYRSKALDPFGTGVTGACEAHFVVDGKQT